MLLIPSASSDGGESPRWRSADPGPAMGISCFGGVAGKARDDGGLCAKAGMQPERKQEQPYFRACRKAYAPCNMLQPKKWSLSGVASKNDEQYPP